ncbi:MarR family transcriptional regulator [Kiritimatiellaeota bacterium B1221]|nr:MarR family transcriptional regulator [Kiritimatiellaeota bacterium B1221]
MENKTLSQIEETFILHWGQMGVQWGINRTVAQVHALLYLSEEALNAEQICEILNVARSNVSTSLKELQGWGIVKKVARMGDKRDHFESLHDVWELARIILNERKKREIDPTREVLQQLASAAESDADTSADTAKRLKEMANFLDVSTTWFDRMNRMPPAALKAFIKLGGPGKSP